MLDFEGRQFNDREVQNLISIVRNNETCQALNLKKIIISIDGLLEFSQALVQNTSLKSLDLSDITILFDKERGTLVADLETILRSIFSHASLETLNIANMPLADIKTSVFADALCINTSLIDLNMSGIKIDSESLKAMAVALRMNVTLKSLNLSEIDGSSDWIRPLFIALRYNHTLSSLSLNGIWFEEEAIARDMLIALRANRGLNSLAVKDEVFPIQVPDNLLAYNTTLMKLDLIWDESNLDSLAQEQIAYNACHQDKSARDIAYRLLNAGFYHLKLAKSPPSAQDIAMDELYVYPVNRSQLMFAAKDSMGVLICTVINYEHRFMQRPLKQEHDHILKELLNACKIENLFLIDKLWLDVQIKKSGFNILKPWLSPYQKGSTLLELSLTAVCQFATSAYDSVDPQVIDQEIKACLPVELSEVIVEATALASKKQPRWVNFFKPATSVINTEQVEKCFCR